jgi:hypothetical protein
MGARYTLQNGGSGGILVNGGGLLQLESLRCWGLSVNVRASFRPVTTLSGTANLEDVAMLRNCLYARFMVHTVAMPNIKLTSRSGAKLLREGGCSGQYKGNLYCLARNLAFLVMLYCSRVSLVTT